MFCRKCGAQLENGTKFCVKCGTPVTQTEAPAKDYSPAVQPVKQNDKNLKKEEKKQGKGLLIGGIIILLLLLAVLGLGVLLLSQYWGKDTEESYEGYLEKAEECVSNGDLDGAISYYKKLLEETPDDESLYIDLAEIYEDNDQEDKAIDILKKGYSETESKKIRKILESDYEIVLEESEDDASEAAEPASEDSDEEIVPYEGVRTDINIEVRQVDNSNFPNMVFYTSVTDKQGNTISKMKKSDFKIQEIDAQGKVSDVSIDDVYQVLNEDKINVNLVLDASGSMDSYNKMQQAKNAAISFLDKVSLETGDKVEVISFGSYVYLEQEFSSERSLISDAVQNITTDGMTALYDALYAGLYQTYYENGAKCVIGFTDGMENASSYTFDDVVNMAKNTGIPLFIVGIGEEYDADVLMNLADQCSGKYYSANVNELETILEDIYLTIYREQQDYYVFEYVSKNLDNPHSFRDIYVQTSEASEFSGNYRKSFVPQADLTGAFSSSYTNMDFMIDDSNVRAITEADLSGMSLAQLRIARNEIFARHGRQFKDTMLNQWFYSKTWYLNIPLKYAPDDFDAIRPSPLSKLESDNANFIKAYEQNIMATQDIYPNAANTLLSDYDLALSKPVLKAALAQMQTYSYTDILGENMRLVSEAIAKEDVQY